MSHHSRPAAEDDPEISDVSADDDKPGPSEDRSSPRRQAMPQPVKSEGASHSGRHGSGAQEPPGPLQDDEPFDPRRFYEDSPRVSLPQTFCHRVRPPPCSPLAAGNCSSACRGCRCRGSGEAACCCCWRWEMIMWNRCCLCIRAALPAPFLTSICSRSVLLYSLASYHNAHGLELSIWQAEPIAAPFRLPSCDLVGCCNFGCLKQWVIQIIFGHSKPWLSDVHADHDQIHSLAFAS